MFPRPLAFLLLAACLAVRPVRAQSSLPAAPPAPTTLTARQWGEETLACIDADFWLPNRRLYAETGHLNRSPAPPPVMAWGAGVQLSALAAAARVDPEKYRPRLRSFIDGFNVYWTNFNGLGGYDVQPGPKPDDRYYDDNAWIVLALADAYEVMHDSGDLARAEATQRFVLSGEDAQLGGGIYWHEPKRESKNTCVNAPAIVGALRLYQLTARPAYLEDARRLYRWTCAHLQGQDGLFADNIRLNGHVNETRYSYNTGLMIRAASLLHRVTGEAAYLADAERIAHAAEGKWVVPETGGIRDSARFAHLLLEGFLALQDEDRDPHWLALDRNALGFVHAQVRDANGHYADHWDRPVASPLANFPLLDEASAARAFWVAAGR